MRMTVRMVKIALPLRMGVRMFRFVNNTKAAPSARASSLAARIRKPTQKRPFNLYLDEKLVAAAALILEPRYGLLSISDMINEFLARELLEKGGLLRAPLATRAKA